MSKSMEEEKLLVAEKLMKWKPKLSTLVGGNTGYWYPHNKFINDENETIEWNPQKDRNCWPKIWEKMENDDSLIRTIYYENIKATIGSEWDLHKSSPEVCWKALIKTLEK